MSTTKIIKSLSFGFGFSALFGSASVLADTYRLDLTINGGIAENDVISNGTDIGSFDVEQGGLTGSVYFSDVDTEEGPYAEAPFLNKSSFARVGSTHFNTIYSNGADQREENFATLHVVAGERVIVEATGATGGVVNVQAGAYIIDTISATAGYTRFDADAGLSPFVGDIEFDAYSINVHGVQSIGDVSAISYDATASYVDGDGAYGSMFDVEGTYYLLQSLGFSAQAGYSTIGGIDLWSIGAGAEYYITPKISLAVDYNYSETDEAFPSYLEINTVTGNAQFRF